MHLFEWVQGEVQRLEELLGMTLAPAETSARSAPQPYLVNLVQDLGRAMPDSSKEGELFVRLCCGEIGLLTKDLDYVFHTDPDLHEALSPPVRRAKTREKYVSARTELRVAVSAMRAGALVKKSESPDLRIQFEGAQMYGEVTSVHATATQSADGFAYKIQYALNDKFKEPYADAATALFVEATHLVKRAVEQKIFSMAAFKRVIEDAALRSHYGSLILLYQLHSTERKRYEAAYQRADSPSILPSLTAFLDASHPVGELSFGHFEVFGKR
jgi:hypothetical protein